MKMIKYKQGQGHIEILLSFLLFIGAIIFIFFYINPFSKTVDNANEVNQVQKIIMDNASVAVGRLSIVVDNPGDCYKFMPGNYLNSNYIEMDEGQRRYTVYFSDIFPSINAPHMDGSAACISIPPSKLNYRLGIFLNETIISYDKLMSIASNCKSDEGYKNTLKNLGIITDFSFNSKDINGNEIPDLSFSRRIPNSVAVESKEFPLRVIKNDGTFTDIIFNLKVW